MKQNELLLLVVSIFIVTVFWIGLSIYHAHANSTITETQNIQVEPITPHFNREVIEKLKARRVVDPLFDSIPAPATQAATVTPTVTPSALVTPAATPASASGSRRP
jgi:hypothetical protein